MLLCICSILSLYILTFENVYKVGELMLQTPSNEGSAAGVQVSYTSIMNLFYLHTRSILTL